MKKYWFILLMMCSFSSLANQNAVVVGDVKIEKAMTGVHVISGIAKNVSNKTVNSVIITYALYENGIKTQETPVIANQLQSNEMWRFEALVVKPFDSYRLQSITYQ